HPLVRKEISMADLPVTSEDISRKQAELIAKIREHGGHAGNVTLQRELGWSEEVFWPIRDRLVDSGLLELGRGRGGSVSMVAQPPVQDATAQATGGQPSAPPAPR